MGVHDNRKVNITMKSKKVRAVWGGAVAVVAVGALATQALIGPAGAAGDQSTNAEPVSRDQKRPNAATSGLASTPLELAVGLAVQEHQETLDQRAEIIRYVSARVTSYRVAVYTAAVARAEAGRAASVKGGTTTGSSSSTSSASGDTSSTLACIRARESDSSGGYSAVNSSSSAGGAYQALPSTWDGYAGYARAEQAPPAIQDQWAREAIAASGTRPWAGSGC